MVMIPPQPDCRLFGSLVRIQPLRYSDLGEMLRWQQFTDPLLRDYNVPFRNLANGERWLRLRLQERWAYSIRNLAQALVGHMSLRQLDPPYTSRLGIGMAPEFVGRGYGQDTMRVFLDYYFDMLGFREMRLDVSALNPRALHLYRTLGFRERGHFWRSAPVGFVTPVKDPAAVRRRQIRFIEMSLRASEWVAAVSNPE